MISGILSMLFNAFAFFCLFKGIPDVIVGVPGCFFCFVSLGMAKKGTKSETVSHLSLLVSIVLIICYLVSSMYWNPFS